MSFRPRENRCKWFNNFREKSIYSQRVWWIVSNDKWYDSHMNRFTMKVIRFIGSQRTSCLFERHMNRFNPCSMRFIQSQKANACFLKTHEMQFWRTTSWLTFLWML